MSLTPIDILHTQFRTGIRGYNKRQVDEFLLSVRQALEQALDEKAELSRRVEALDEEVERIRGIEATMTSALTLAQKTADELRSNAHRQAEMILRESEQERVRMTIEAQKEAEKFRSEIELLRATRSRFEAELRAMLSAYLEWLDRGLPTAVIASERSDSPQPAGSDLEPPTSDIESRVA